MSDVTLPHFKLSRIYSNGLVTEPEIYRIYEFNGEWNLDRRSFLKTVGAGISVLGAGLVAGCGGGGSSSSPTNAYYSSNYSLNSIAHSSVINSHAITHDNTILASTDNEGGLKFWEFPSGQLLQAIAIANITNSSDSVVFSPDGSLIASSWGNQYVRLWYAETGESVLDIDTQRNNVGKIAFNPDGTKLAVAAYMTDSNIYGIDLFDVSTGKLLDTLLPKEVNVNYSEPISDIAFTRDGNMMASVSGEKYEGHLTLWQISATGGSILHDLLGYQAKDLAFLLDDSLLASGGAPDDVVRIWDANTGTLLQTLSDLGSVEAVSNSGWVISGSTSNGIKIWDAKTTNIVRQIDEYAYVENITSNPDGNTFLSTSGGIVRQWDLATGTPMTDINVEDSATIAALSISPDGSLFVTKSSDTTIRIWAIATTTQVLVIDPLHIGIAWIIGFNTDGDLVTTAQDRTIKYWQVPTGKLLRTQVTNTDLDGLLVVSNNYSMAALTALGGVDIVVWDLINNQEIIRLPGNGSNIIALKFSPDDSLLASSTTGYNIVFWDVATGTQVKVITTDDYNLAKLAFSPDGTLLASLGLGGKVWDVKTGDSLFDIANDLPYYTTTLAFSHDGKYLALGTFNAIELVAIPTGEVIKLWSANTACLTSVAFDRKTSYLSSSSGDGRIRLWKIPTCDFITSFLDPNALYGMSLKYYSLVNENGDVILYTMPCSSSYELPQDSTCVCNCVDGLSANKAPTCQSGGGGSGGGGGGGGIPICTCNSVCICVPVYY